ncbi:MAG TPA: polysaccharide deacetylase family protein [Clostridium sp.]
MQFKKISLILILVLAFPGCANHRQNLIQTNSSNTNQNNSISKTDGNKNTNPKSNSISDSNSQTGSKTFSPIILDNISSLQRKTINWSWAYSPRDNSTLLSKYHGYAFGQTSKKTIYLTFDEGYENGYTASILDTLKANNVKAAFFVTQPYVTGSFNGIQDINLVKRMMNEGHIIGNHSVHHKSMPSITDEATFNSEITENETTVNNISGLKMSKFFRPPMGDFSELSLYYTQKLGYKSIFFTLAYHDYDPKNQLNPETAKENLLKETKPGMICLLHAVSKTNAEILDSLIKEWKSQGYEFKTLNDLP